MMDHGIMNELDAIFTFPTLIDIASKNDRMTVLQKDPSLIEYIKKPTEEEQKFVLLEDIKNISLIHNISSKVVLDVYRIKPEILSELKEIPEGIQEYIVNNSIDTLLFFYPKPFQFIKKIVYILYERRKMHKASDKGG